MGFGSDEPDVPGGAAGVVRALRTALEAALERERRLELRVAELERRLRMDSSGSGTPPSKEPIGAKERHLSALAAFFGVSPMYFFDDTEADRDTIPPELIAALKDGEVREMALRAAGLSNR